MSRISDGSPSTQPHTMSALLRTLHINDMSVDKQKVVLREWLHDHTPDPDLRLSMRRNGYGLLLDERFGRIARRTAGHG
jgi:hypothetical protein